MLNGTAGKYIGRSSKPHPKVQMSPIFLNVLYQDIQALSLIHGKASIGNCCVRKWSPSAGWQKSINCGSYWALHTG
jgi:hypothetical protein